MPLSFGILIGLLTIGVGALVYMGTQQKKAGLYVIGAGAAVALLTLGVVVLAIISDM